MMMNIVVIVLSSILLILVIGLIFKKDFREDVLKAENDNEAEFKGFKLKGALFWVIYAATAFGTIYLAMNQTEVVAQDCTPLLSPVNSGEWLAFDIKEEKPAILEYGCCDNKEQEDHSNRSLKMHLALNNDFEIISSKSNFVFGELDRESLKNLNLTNDLKVEKYVEIKYDLQLSPYFKTTRDNNNFYDWNEYQNLPFQIAVKFSSERGIHSIILNDEGKKQLMDPLSLNDKWAKVIAVNGKRFLVRLRARDTDPSNAVPEYANFQVLQFSGDIF
jgi:hypothetical protein